MGKECCFFGQIVKHEGESGADDSADITFFFVEDIKGERGSKITHHRWKPAHFCGNGGVGKAVGSNFGGGGVVNGDSNIVGVVDEEWGG